ncbi:MAG: DUF1501 domain-containing protein [Myxococcales bacterium]|nr:DUF1501 domain-containing protein [Myxococcales bacterium]
MDRRSFLKLSALTGLAVATPIGAGLTRKVWAEAQAYGGPFFVLVNASGGYDPIFLCDPKLNPEFNRVYGSTATAGNITYAPIEMTTATTGLDPASAAYLMSTTAFFEKYADRLLCVNGVDMSTNNHDGGTRATWSGQLQEGYPSLGAIIAAAKAPAEPLAFISSGGYDATEGIVPLTRMSSVDTLRKIAYPNIYNPDDPMSGRFHAGETMNRIRAAQEARVQGLRDGQGLPRARAAMDELYVARQNDDTLQALVLPTELVTLGDYNVSDLERMMQQAQLALAAFQSGLAVAVNLNLGGFDTHGNHDRDQVRQLGKLLAGVDYLMEQAAAMGLANQITVMIGSDFGRGPFYNGPGDYNGKDHWSITSAMFMGAGVNGNRVVGSTDDAQRAVPYNGTTIGPAHLNIAMRKLAGVDGSEHAQAFPLAGEDIGLL